MHQGFEVVPDSQGFLEQIGYEPEDEGSEGVRVLTLAGEAGRIRLSYDILGRSIRVRWDDEKGCELLDIFREGAERMSITSESGRTWISVRSPLPGFTAELRVHVYPALKVTDTVFFV